MTSHTTLATRLRARRRRSIARARAIASELNYAQRRMFELRTGLPSGHTADEVERLERLYAL